MRNRILGLFATAFMLSAMAWAQTTQAPAANPTAKPGHGREGIFQQLNLTQDQRAKIESFRQSERSQIQALRSNTSLTDDQKKQQIRDLRKTDHQQLLAILTPEQQAQLKQLQGARKGRAEGFKAGRGLQALNLTDQQKQELKPVFQSTHQQMQALRSDTTLTPEQKREKMKEIRQNQMSQMKSILTPDQLQQLHQMRGRRMHKGAEQQSTPPSA